MTSFISLGISPPILTAIEEMGFLNPTEVQSRAVPKILKQEDLIIISKTGSGKTAAFGMPILELTDPELGATQALILTPTRELAIQVDHDLMQMAKHLKHKTTAVYGQHNINIEIRALSKHPEIVTGTPGRVYDHLQRGQLVTKHIKFLVIDEADRMLDMGFIDQVVRIIKKLPKERVTLLFSATMPEEVRRLCLSYMKTPETIEIASETKTVDLIHQVYYRVERNEKRTQLERLLLIHQPESCMIFCNTRRAVDQVQSFLQRQGFASMALHGEIPQNKRQTTIESFKKQGFHILVATDVAARGIHIEDLSLVINYDVPEDKDSYVHRIGRTGRAGKAGQAMSLVTGDDLMSLYEIEEHINVMITEADLPTEADVAAHKATAAEWKKAKALPQEKGAARETRRPKTESASPSGSAAEAPKKNRSKRRRPAKSGEPAKESLQAQVKPLPASDKSSAQSKPPHGHARRQGTPNQYHPHRQAPQPSAAISSKASSPVVVTPSVSQSHHATTSPAPKAPSKLARFFSRLFGKTDK